MPKRTRQHELETESRIRFSSVIPNNWLFRDISPDYGIDGIVEVFEENGNASGGIFLIQLKATDEEKIERALHVVLKTDSGKYYANILLPVLIVLFHSKSNNIFARFFDKKMKIPNNQKTFTFILSEKDLWDNNLIEMANKQLSWNKSAMDMGLREKLIDEYYKYKSSHEIDEEAKIINNVSNIKNGCRVKHYVFGDGTIEDITDYYLFVKFDKDTMARKFDPVRANEFIVV